MAQVDMKGDVPVGAIVPFFGEVPMSVTDAGWLICDGTPLLQADWPDLSAAIGQAFGFTSKDVDFCLPDLRGVFLRTIDAGAGRDPGVKDRMASGPDHSGATGDLVGSIQFDATRLPRNTAFSIKGKLAMGHNTTHGGCSDSNRINYKSASTDRPFEGGDAESRPANLSGNYLIKARPNIKSNAAIGQIPIGAAIAMPLKPGEDTPVDDFWRYCDGQTFIAAKGSTFYRLFEMIGQANGGVKGEPGEAQRFAAPDLRGLFVRGHTGLRDGPRFDPDRNERETPRPDLDMAGNAGNLVGSYEGWATSAARSPGLSIPIHSYPFDATSGYQSGLATAASHKGDSKSFDVGGGDAETRPISMSVEWFVRFMSSGDQSKPGEELPLCTVVAAATIEELEKWRPCDGRTLLITEFEPLFKILGTRFGGDGTTNFCLPDMRGRFLRGAGDPAMTYPRPRGQPAIEAGTVQDDTTAAPSKPFKVTLANWPGDSTSDVIDYGTGYELLKLESEKTVDATGGEAETRPINVYVQHLIKVRL